MLSGKAGNRKSVVQLRGLLFAAALKSVSAFPEVLIQEPAWQLPEAEVDLLIHFCVGGIELQAGTGVFQKSQEAMIFCDAINHEKMKGEKLDAWGGSGGGRGGKCRKDIWINPLSITGHKKQNQTFQALQRDDPGTHTR